MYAVSGMYNNIGYCKHELWEGTFESKTNDVYKKKRTNHEWTNYKSSYQWVIINFGQLLCIYLSIVNCCYCKRVYCRCTYIKTMYLGIYICVSKVVHWFTSIFDC